jgi:drug/metabolite transporter (DMT)-like permease
VEGPLVVAGAEPRVRRPVLGFAMVFGAATLFGLNGPVAKVALASGLSSLRLSEARCAGAAIGLMLIVLVRSPRALRVDRRDLLRLAVFGVVGVALVQLF